MDLNRAQIIGNVTRDPDSRTIPSGQNVCSFTVATNLRWKDQNGQPQERAEFHNVVTWRKLADICSQYVKKGRRIYVEGRLQTHSWQDQNGVKKYRTEILADNIILLDRKGTEETTSSQLSEAEAPQSSPEEQPKQSRVNVEQKKTEEEIDINDIPF